MEFSGRKLSLGLKGNEVRLLHNELVKLGYSLPSEELDSATFGEATNKIVLKFQEDHKLPPTGIIDQDTIAKINEASRSLKRNGAISIDARVKIQKPIHSAKSIEFKMRRKELAAPRRLINELIKRKIKSSSDLIRADIIELRKDLDPRYYEDLNHMISFAKLDDVSPTANVSNALLDAGFSSIREVSRMPIKSLEAVLAGLPKKDISATYQRVRAANLILNNYEFAARSGYSIDKAADVSTILSEEGFVEGGCSDCLSAVSPLAYLVDLFDYALSVLRKNNSGLSAGGLEEILMQPLSSIPMDCDTAMGDVLYPRLTSEVLIRYLSSNLALGQSVFHINKDIEKAEREYLLKAYKGLLNGLGTSYEEIKAARLLDRTDQSDIQTLNWLADKIGIDRYVFDPVSGSQIDLINALFKTPDQLSMSWLERIFGLIDIERDPLVYGPINAYGEGASQLDRWNLRGIKWGSNTDQYGRIHITISASGNCRTIGIYQDSAHEIGITFGEIFSNSDFVQLIPRDNGLKGYVYLNYKHPSDDIIIEVIPKIIVWRLLHLRRLWAEQDWPKERHKPIIDPDLIGPEDFRYLAKPELQDKAFGIWVKRRRWVDERVRELQNIKNAKNTPDLSRILARMYEYIHYDDFSVQPWKNTTVPENFESLSIILNNGVGSETANQRINADLQLSIDSFTRLLEIIKKYHFEENNANQSVEKEDWEDLYSVLVQAQKERLYSLWLEEEQNNNVKLSADQFWISLQEPKAGFWPPEVSKEEPLIDPGNIKLEDFSDSAIGKKASQLWDGRNKELKSLKDRLRTTLKEKGFDAMLELALGEPVLELENINGCLITQDPVETREAIGKIENGFRMTVDNFQKLMAAKARSRNSASSQKITNKEWADVFDILANSWNKIKKFTLWSEEEETLHIDKNNYWIIFKTRLPRWRSTKEDRQEWQRLLEYSSQASNIDIDVIDEKDLRVSNDKIANDIYLERQNVKSEYVLERRQIMDNAINAVQSGNNPKALDEFISKELELGFIDELQDLSKKAKSGNDIRKRLQQIGLQPKWFDRIIHLKDLDLVEDEKNDILEILWQCHKIHLLGSWHKVEHDANLIIGPDYFVDREKMLDYQINKILPVELRWNYEDKLSSRIDQDREITSAIADLLRNAEAEIIVPLKDALVLLEESGQTLTDKLKILSDKFHVDFSSGPGQTSNRVMFAIEALQGIMLQVRNSSSENSLTLGINDYEFDDAWHWIGSYSTWRSAMFVFLYPENILYPNLHQKNSEAFDKIMEDKSYEKKLNPEMAETCAGNYYKYLNDIAYLQLDCSVRAEVRHAQPATTYCASGGGFQKEERVFLFGVSTSSGQAYFTSFPAGYYDGRDCDFWNPIKEIVGSSIRIIGASVYYIDKKRYIYLFYRQDEAGLHKLKFIRYDLDNASWIGKIFDLDLPQENKDFTAQVEQCFGNCSLTSPPRLIIAQNISDSHGISNPHYIRDLYLRSLDNRGMSWAEGQWDAFILKSRERINGLWAAIGLDNKDLCIFAIKENVQSYQIIRNSKAATDWIPIIKGERFRGVAQYPGQKTVDVAIEKTLIRLDFLSDPNGKKAIEIKLPKGIGNIVPLSGKAPGSDILEIATWLRSGDKPGIYVWAIQKGGGSVLSIKKKWRAAPWVSLMLKDAYLSSCRSPRKLQFIAEKVKGFFIENDSLVENNIKYVMEAFYLLPMHLGLQLRRSGYLIQSLQWLRMIYDYEAPPGYRKIYYGLVKEETTPGGFTREQEWLKDPINPHNIAKNRAYAYTRFTLITIISCLLDLADGEFTQDTSESVPRARVLYEKALDLLDTDALRQDTYDNSFMVLDSIILKEEDPLVIANWTETKSLIINLPSEKERLRVAKGVKAIMNSEDIPIETKFSRARSIMASSSSIPHTYRSKNLGTIIENRERTSVALEDALIKDRDVERDCSLLNSIFEFPVSEIVSTSAMKTSWAVFTPCLDFCIQPNPIVKTLRMRAENGLSKIRSGRNIAGIKRDLELYPASSGGLPIINEGQLVLPGASNPSPMPYRYVVLIERAKKLVDLASQIEASMLSSIEKGTAVAYDMLRASQDLDLANMNIVFHTSKVNEANDEKLLAISQKARATTQKDHYDTLIRNGESEFEKQALQSMQNAMDFLEEAEPSVAYPATLSVLSGAVSGAITGAAIGGPAGALVGGALGGLMGGMSSGYQSQKASEQARAAYYSSQANFYSTQASYERRAEDWSFQKSLAEKDEAIGDGQITLANDHITIATNEYNIACAQATNAEAILNFLNNKFLNTALYEWMSDVLEGIYCFFLQQGTAMAILAANQLAFERRVIPPIIIQGDYWKPPSSDESGSASSDEKDTDKRGLTGSARLLQDIYKLDQYAFDTDKRKLQLIKTVSLSRIDPYAFQIFKQTGNLRFSMPMQLFDYDFPGHYLRLIKRVRISVIALVPPNEGIHATLSSMGISRTVIGGDIFQQVVIKRDPETVALTSSINASGIFELDQQSDMLYPFESTGVDTMWEFCMPKASNQFDYRSISDILMTIEYTALNSFDYRQQVARTLRSTISEDRMYSFRERFADQWYDLHNPNQTATPMAVRFVISREDFPPNLDSIKIQHLMLYFVRTSGKSFEVPVRHLHFTAKGSNGYIGGSAISIDGVISTRFNAASWVSMIGREPFGAWELAFSDMDTSEMNEIFGDEGLKDILFIITYSGRTPQWNF